MLDYEKAVLDTARDCINAREQLNCSQARELIELYSDFRDAMHDLYAFATINGPTFRHEYIAPNKDNARRLEWLARRLWNALQHLQSLYPDWGVLAQREYQGICETLKKCFPLLETEEELIDNV